MKNRRRIAVLAVFFGVGLAALGAGEAAGDARERFRAGLSALEDGRAADAEALFRQAIAERGEEKPPGLRRSYLPHYYLGVALAEQRRCREALDAWAESERQGQVFKSRDEGAALAGRKQKCQEQVRAARALAAARAAAEQAVSRARSAEQAVARWRAMAELEAVWSQGEPSLASRQQRALDRLEQAAASLRDATGGHDVAPFQAVKARANQAAGEFEAIAADAEVRLAELRDATASALERLEAAEAAARAALAAAAYLKPYPPNLARRFGEVRRALDAALEAKAAARPQDLAALQSTLNDSAARLRRAALGPPENLRTAAEAFLGGDYEGVLATLEGESYRDPRAAGQVCLLRAAARHALYVLGEAGAELAGRLHEDVTACRELVAPQAIPAKFFSPRFVRFYENPPPPEAEADPGGEVEAAEPEGEGTTPADHAP